MPVPFMMAANAGKAAAAKAAATKAALSKAALTKAATGVAAHGATAGAASAGAAAASQAGAISGSSFLDGLSKAGDTLKQVRGSEAYKQFFGSTDPATGQRVPGMKEEMGLGQGGGSKGPAQEEQYPAEAMPQAIGPRLPAPKQIQPASPDRLNSLLLQYIQQFGGQR